MSNKRISELPYIDQTKISGNTLVPLVTYYSAVTGTTVHTYVDDFKDYILSGVSGLTEIYVTGGTYSANTITFTNNTGGTFTVTGITVTGTTIMVGDYLPLSGGTVTGSTSFTSGLNSNIISATTYQNLPISGLTAGNNINISGSNGNFTISVTGITSGTTFTGNTSATCINDLYVSNLHGCSPITIHDSIQFTGSVATGLLSYAEGRQTTASGDYSHAEGRETMTSGNYSHAEGYLSTTVGSYSHVEGERTAAFGRSSHTEGIGTITVGDYQHVQGMWNVTGDTTQGAFIVGNGSDNNNRSNLIFAAGNQVNISGKTTTTNFRMTSGATNGYVLTSDGNGNASWKISEVVGNYLPLSGGTVSGGTSFTSGLSANTIYITTTPTTDTQTTTQYLTRDSSTGQIKTKVIPGPTVYGLFAQTGNSTTISGTTSELSIIDGGIGTLSVPANGFNIGDSFRADFGGLMSSKQNDDIRIRIKSGSVVLADSGLQNMDAGTNDVWQLSVNFTIRKIGGPTQAEIVTLGVFHTTKQSNGAQTGFAFNTVNNTTFDTTIPNQLDVTVQFSSTDPLNKIYSDIFVLNKIY